VIVLIPAYQPDINLVNLVKQIKECSGFDVIVVDDGSNPILYTSIFKEVESLGCTVLLHTANRGKGRALKTGFEYIFNETHESDGVITADADGQHLWLDIQKVAKSVVSFPQSITLGVRNFTGKVPLRSTLGNKITSLIFSLVSRKDLRDTQTGLRGFPVSILPWLITIEGERYEYEMNMLLMADSEHIQLKQINIETIYYKGNKSSHFNMLKDSILIYIPILKFCFSSLCGAAIDYSLLFVIQYLINNLFIAVLGARLISSTVNFILNRFFVFGHEKHKIKTVHEAVKYYILACMILISNYLLLRFFFHVSRIPLLWSKILTEAILFVFSYYIQYFFVFKARLNKDIMDI
jgi:putative flippase GtrA